MKRFNLNVLKLISIYWGEFTEVVGKWRLGRGQTGTGSVRRWLVRMYIQTVKIDLN
jgi:hypothetical protein